MLNILILCTGNSCRSIMAEALINHHAGLMAPGRLHAQSAGSRPTGKVHPRTLSTLLAHGIETAGLASKSWDDLANEPFDAVITVCDAAAGEACPLFPGTPALAHWGLPDPASAEGSEMKIQAVFDRVFETLALRASALAKLANGNPANKADLGLRLAEIGLKNPQPQRVQHLPRRRQQPVLGHHALPSGSRGRWHARDRP